MFDTFCSSNNKNSTKRMRKRKRKKKKCKYPRKISKILSRITSMNKKSIFKNKLSVRRLIIEKKKNTSKKLRKSQHKIKESKTEKKQSFFEDVKTGLGIIEDEVWEKEKEICEYYKWLDEREMMYEASKPCNNRLNPDNLNQIYLSNTLNQSFHNERTILVPFEIEDYESYEVEIENKRMKKMRYQFGEIYDSSGYLFVKKIDEDKKIMVFGTDLRIFFYNYGKGFFYKKNPVIIEHKNDIETEFDPYSSYCFINAFIYTKDKFLTQEKWFDWYTNDNIGWGYSLTIWDYSKGFGNTVFGGRISLPGFKLLSIIPIDLNKRLFLCNMIYFKLEEEFNIALGDYIREEDYLREEIVIAEITNEKFIVKQSLSLSKKFTNFSLFSSCMYNTNSLALFASGEVEENINEDYLILYDLNSGKWESFEVDGISSYRPRMVYANNYLYFVNVEREFFGGEENPKVIVFDLLKKEFWDSLRIYDFLGKKFEIYGYSTAVVKDFVPINNTTNIIIRFEDSIIIWDYKYQRVLFENLQIFYYVLKKQYYFGIYPLCDKGNTLLVYQRYFDDDNKYVKNYFSTIRLFDLDYLENLKNERKDHHFIDCFVKTFC